MNRQLEQYNKGIFNISCTFLGRPTSQVFSSFFVWEKILTAYDFERIIEFGTWKGNLSLYLFLFCLSENAEFYTFDNMNSLSYFHKEDDILKEKLEFNKHFYQWNIFDHEEEINKFIQKEGRTIIFCDNGDKEREFNTFVKSMKVEDIIGVHDWESETHLEKIQETINKYYLEMILEKECKEYETIIRFFIKKQ